MINNCFKPAGFIACLVAVLAMSGGHWLVLQSFAWARMVVNFSDHAPIGSAITKTFSGAYPCSLCLKIRQGWQQDKQTQERLPWTKAEQMPQPFWELRSVIVPAAPTAASQEQPVTAELYSEFIDRPPTPPPRLFATL